MNLRVVSVAIRIDKPIATESGMQVVPLIISAPPPARHHNIIHSLAALNQDPIPPEDQGFLLSDGRFAPRSSAWIVAQMAGQFLPRAPTGPTGTLFSEDLW